MEREHTLFQTSEAPRTRRSIHSICPTANLNFWVHQLNIMCCSCLCNVVEDASRVVAVLALVRPHHMFFPWTSFLVFSSTLQYSRHRVPITKTLRAYFTRLSACGVAPHAMRRTPEAGSVQHASYRRPRTPLSWPCSCSRTAARYALPYFRIWPACLLIRRRSRYACSSLPRAVPSASLF
jgi:hypothetical protein